MGVGDDEVGEVVDVEKVGVGHFGANCDTCFEFFAEMVAIDLSVDRVGVYIFGVKEVFHPAFQFDEAESVAGMGNGNGVDRRRHVNDAFFFAVKLLYFVEIDDGCRYGLSAEAGRLA